MKATINVNRHVIASNRPKVNETRKLTGKARETAMKAIEPVLSAKTSKSNKYGRHILIRDRSGEVLVRVLYLPFTPLSCGAAAWIECVDHTLVEVKDEFYERPKSARALRCKVPVLRRARRFEHYRYGKSGNPAK